MADSSKPSGRDTKLGFRCREEPVTLRERPTLPRNSENTALSLEGLLLPSRKDLMCYKGHRAGNTATIELFQNCAININHGGFSQKIT